MQYILTQDEYNTLLTKQKLEIKLQKEKLQQLCTKIANTMPVERSWDDNDRSPWGCILTINKESYDEWFCDDCPVQSICPYEFKNWSQ
jgi:hypothetical protein